MQPVLSGHTVGKDFLSGLVVFLVALPLCLGVALASFPSSAEIPPNLFSGLIAGIVGGIVVGILSGSHTSVSGPAAGLTTVVAAQILALGSFEAFLVTVVIGGFLQIVLGFVRAGFLAEYFPTSVIKGLLAAIGLILILKQIPHLLGHDRENEHTFRELFAMLSDLHPGAIAVGIGSLLLLVAWDKIQWLKKTGLPAALIVVVLGVIATLLLRRTGTVWQIDSTHLVNVPTVESAQELVRFFVFPDWNALANPKVYVGGLTIALVASLETLLNLEAVDRIDPKHRVSPTNRELVAQGVGNMASGLIGGLPITSVIVRSSVNIQTGNKTKLSTIFHGALLLICIVFIPHLLNLIPLSCLAAILIVTGYKLAAPRLIHEMWKRGPNQFLPFAITIVAIVVTDLLIGVLIGLGVSIAFILHSNLSNPLTSVREKHAGGDVVRVELGNQVSFLNRVALQRTLESVKRGEHLLIDARATQYMDPDVEDLLIEFDQTTGPDRGIHVSMLGFHRADGKPKLPSRRLLDRLRLPEISTSQLQRELSPADILDLLQAGNERSCSGKRIIRDLGKKAPSPDQSPLAVILSCVDAKAPAEYIFDLGLGDIFSVRITGNVAPDEVLGSLEYGCVTAGAKLILVLGHTRCGVIRTALHGAGCATEHAANKGKQTQADLLIGMIRQSFDNERLTSECADGDEPSPVAIQAAQQNVLRVIREIEANSETLRELIQTQRIMLCGAIYDDVSGKVDFSLYRSL